jgi:hypothetical protein
MTSERATYRIDYGGGGGARFHLQGDRWPAIVADCSETGVRFVRAGDESRALSPGDRVEGEMRFCNGSRVRVSGRVVRLRETEVAVHLDEAPIPFPDIMREQMYLRRNHQVPRTPRVGDPVTQRKA